MLVIKNNQFKSLARTVELCVREDVSNWLQSNYPEHYGFLRGSDLEHELSRLLDLASRFDYETTYEILTFLECAHRVIERADDFPDAPGLERFSIVLSSGTASPESRLTALERAVFPETNIEE